tara:strand:+ start:75997 stop:76317 length:321 start_codon:yes stop_codon:yes gene_type:complete
MEVSAGSENLTTHQTPAGARRFRKEYQDFTTRKTGPATSSTNLTRQNRVGRMVFDNGPPVCQNDFCVFVAEQFASDISYQISPVTEVKIILRFMFRTGQHPLVFSL